MLPLVKVQVTMSYLFQKTKEQWLAEGDAHYQVKRYEEALEAYVNVLLIDPNAAAVYAAH